MPTNEIGAPSGAGVLLQLKMIQVLIVAARFRPPYKLPVAVAVILELAPVAAGPDVDAS